MEQYQVVVCENTEKTSAILPLTPTFKRIVKRRAEPCTPRLQPIPNSTQNLKLSDEAAKLGVGFYRIDFRNLIFLFRKFFDKKRSAGQVSTESSKGAAATSSFGDVSKKRRTMTKNIVESDDENLDIENSGMDQAQSIVCEKENSPDLNDENGDYIKKHEIKQAKIGQPSTQGKLMETESSSTGDSTLKTAKQDDGTEREVSRA